MLTAVLLGFLFALILIFAGKFFKGKFAVLSSLIPLSLFIYFLSFIPKVLEGKVIREVYNWVPSFGASLTFTLDGLSLLFCLMITGIGSIVFIYTSSYLHGHKYLDRFYGYLSVFMAAMLGLVLSDNLISIFMFWELTSISSFFLIGFNNTEEGSRKSALIALGITGLGGMFLLAGAMTLGNITGTYSISEMLTMPTEAIKGSEYYSLAVLMFFGAAFTKSAQFPFHFWLPGAMKAPTPVSTYLHSATMVKAGIYLMMRFTPILGDEPLWNNTLIIVGAITMLYSAFHSLFRTDLKGVLAYSTISALGILMFLIGLGTTEAFTAAAVFIIVHALYKATLFLTTGIIDHQTGSRNITQLGGLMKVLMPVGIAAIIAGISSAGIPPTIGFLGKELTYEATMHAPIIATILIVSIIITKILLLWAGFVAGISPFRGKLPDSLKETKMPSPLMWFPPLILAVLSLLFGLMPGLIQDSLIKPLVKVMGGASEEIHLALWHGFNTIFILSLVTITVGTLLYFIIKPSAKLETAIGKLEFISPKSIMHAFNRGFVAVSSFWTRTFQNGYLRNYVFVIIFFLVCMVASTMITSTEFRIDFNKLSNIGFYELVVCVIMSVAILYTVFTKSRLSAVVGMGVIGLSFCLIFVFYSAPDLAMTQFSIDTLTVILFVLVLYRLPRYLKIQDRKMKIRDGILALLFGSTIGILALEVLAEPVNSEIGDFYAENSYIMAHGKNVVNVILVDFRGADTMIEISVLTIAAIGVFGLLKLRLKRTDRVQ